MLQKESLIRNLSLFSSLPPLGETEILSHTYPNASNHSKKKKKKKKRGLTMTMHFLESKRAEEQTGVKKLPSSMNLNMSNVNWNFWAPIAAIIAFVGIMATILVWFWARVR